MLYHCVSIGNGFVRTKTVVSPEPVGEGSE